MLQDLLAATVRRRQDDAVRFASLDSDLCQLCHAYGADKRSLFVDCFYAIEEAVPEAIDLTDCPTEGLRNRGYYLRICKACRGDLLRLLGLWRNERVALREFPKDHDGGMEEEDAERNIPVRMNGTTVMMSADDYARYCQRREG